MIIPHDIRHLVEKYRKPGPRYTSYPSALYFQEEAALDDLLESTRQSESPLSLYLHIPFCKKLCWFCGCHSIITRDGLKANHYLNLLEKEMDLFLPNLRDGRKVQQMHFGGGTPNFLSVEQIDRLKTLLRSRFEFSANSENSVELAPAHLEQEQVEAFRGLGMNRASFGVQDCNPEVQQAINRIQPKETNRQVMGWLRDAGYQSANIDLVYGLPRQDLETFTDTLEHAISLEPDRIALFGYAHVPWIKPAQKILEKSGLPDGELRLELFLLALEKLSQAGYCYIGLDHFAKPGDELALAQVRGELYRNFQGYSTHSGHEIIAFGISSISQSSDAYRQNLKELKDYQNCLAADKLPYERGLRLNKDDWMRRDIIQEVMCNLRLDVDRFSSRYPGEFEPLFQEAVRELEGMEKDGLVELNPGSIQVTDLGRLFLRNIAMEFDAYKPNKPQVYSKTL